MPMRRNHRPYLLWISTLLLTVLAASDIARAQERESRPPRPEELDFEIGAASIPDRATYVKMSHQGDAGRDAYLNDIQFVKFQIEHAGSDKALLYFINTRNFKAHPFFMREIGLRGGFGRGRGGPGGAREPGGVGGAGGPGRQMRGAIAYRPLIVGPDGTPGVYTFDFQPNDSFSLDLLLFCYEKLLAKAPFLRGKLVYHPLRGGLARYEREKGQYEAAKLPVYLDDRLERDFGFLPLNAGTTFGRLRLMSRHEIPAMRDVVLYETLPNELPRVAGIITAERQTPLSHVNLRAVQDRVPNAFVTGAAKNAAIRPLIGKLVRYQVAVDGFDLRAATREEVEQHFAALRPETPQVPLRDLSKTRILSLEEIGFADSGAFGVKVANVAAMRKFGLPDGMIPDGYGVPFFFYDSFMRHNDLYAIVEAMLGDVGFRAGGEARSAGLARLRFLVQSGDFPDELFGALGKLQGAFASGTPIRCRSSTNNEDLPGFSGAGLYSSCSHESGEGHIASSIKQVYASLWSDRAFEERDFYRIDHLSAAMGVLIHRSYRGERANGVAVSADVLYQTEGNYFLNVQVGEDLVTNPEEQSVPEEVLLDWWETSAAEVMQRSNRVGDEQRILSPEHLDTLRRALAKIHAKFAKLYRVDYEDPAFAMEIEFKVTKEDKVAIKQARPWVFGDRVPKRLPAAERSGDEEPARKE